MNVGSRWVCMGLGVAIGGLGVTSRVDALWIDDFDNNDPYTNGQTIGWATGLDGDSAGGVSRTVESGRDGVGTVEIVGAGGQKRTYSTAAALPELGFFNQATQLRIEDYNSSVYQSDGTLGGGTSNVNSYIFVSAFGGAGSSLPRSFPATNTGDGFRIWHSNSGSVIVGVYEDSVQIGTDQTINGVGFNGTNYDIVLDLDPVNYTLSIYLSSDNSLVGSISAAHGLSSANWSVGADAAFLVFQAGSDLGGRAGTISVGRVTAGVVPEPTTMGLLAAGGLALLARRRMADGAAHR